MSSVMQADTNDNMSELSRISTAVSFISTTGQGVDAIALASDLVNTAREAMAAAQFDGEFCSALAEILFDATRKLYVAGRSLEAIPIGEEASDLRNASATNGSRESRTREIVDLVVALSNVYNGHADEGVATLRRILGAHANETKASILPARCLYIALSHLGRYDEAAEHMRQVVDQHRGLAQMHVREQLRDALSRLELGEGGAHGYRVGKLAALLAEDAGCQPDFVAMVEVAARKVASGNRGNAEADATTVDLGPQRRLSAA